MATIEQIEANRRNAQKSTGPRTPEGKAVSKMNALKTGIDAEALLICGENKADLEALIADYYQEFQPATPEERCIVDIAIRAEWQMRRLSAVEAELWEHQIDQLPEKEGYLRGHAFQLADATFARLQRRIEQTERSFHRALHELERIRESRETPDPDTPIVIQAIENNPVPPQIGFVPQEGTRGESRAPSAGTQRAPEGASPRFPPPPLRANQKDDAPFSNPSQSRENSPSRRLSGESESSPKPSPHATAAKFNTPDSSKYPSFRA